MKHGKNPTRVQKERLIKLNIDPHAWLVVYDNESVFMIVNRTSGAVRRFWKKRERNEGEEVCR